MTPKKQKRAVRTIQVGKSKPRSLEYAFAGKGKVRLDNPWIVAFLREMSRYIKPKKPPGAQVFSGGLPGLGKRK